MKHYKPTTSSRRAMTTVDFSVLTSDKPEKSLVKGLTRKGGRGYRGHITVRHQGGGSKKKYRLIDFKGFDKLDIPGRIVSIEYDPNRTCFIALVNYKDGEKRYILAPEGLKVGQEIVCGLKTDSKLGNRMYLKNILPGSLIHNVELIPRAGGRIARSAGSAAQILSCEDSYAHIKLSSGEVRKVKDTCFASLGQLTNLEHGAMVIGKAGRSRHLGIRPTVRGTAMNPCDHPHGGGEQRQPIGLRRGPKTPWGKLARGVKTRNKKKWSSRFIIKKRTKN